MSQCSRKLADDIVFIESLCDEFEDRLRAKNDVNLGDFLRSRTDRLEASNPNLVESLLRVKWDFLVEGGQCIDLADDVRQRLAPREHLEAWFAMWNTARLKGQDFAEFRLLELLGSGRFGGVWKALDGGGNIVAVKVAHPGVATDEVRFFREGKVIAELNHPGIAKYKTVGKEAGRAFLVREYIEGESLAEKIESCDLEWQEAVSMVLELSQTLSYSHRMGCVHRDIKPQNIMLCKSGALKIIDFGMAKDLFSESQLTEPGEIMGSAAYMSPEQAVGHGDAADARSDIYSLGVVLFELLTKQRPFQGQFPAIFNQVIHQPSPRVRNLNRLIPKDLDLICDKCLRKRPEERYPSMDELADDLKRLQYGEPVLASPQNQITRAVRFLRSNPVVAFLSLGLLLAVSALAIGGLVVAYNTSVMLERESELLREAESARHEAVDLVVRLRQETDLANETMRYLEALIVDTDPINQILNSGKPVEKPSASSLRMLDSTSRRLSKELAKEPRLKARVLDVIAGVNCSFGRLELADSQLKDAETARATLGLAESELRSDYAVHFFSKGRVRQFQGDYENAEICYKRSLDLHSRDVDAMTSGRSLGDVYFQMGWMYQEWQKPIESEKALCRARELFGKHLDADHRLIWVTDLGIKICRVGELGEEDLLKILNEAPDSLKTLGAFEIAMNLLQADVQSKLGNLQFAASLQKSAVEKMSSIGFEGSQWDLLVKGMYAGTLQKMGDYGEALAIIEPTLENAIKTYPRHPHLMDAGRRFAYELFLAERFKKAEEWYRHVLTDTRAKHWLVNEHSLRFVEVLLALGKHAEAEEIIHKINFSPLDASHEIWIQHTLSRICEERGDAVKAKFHLNKAMNVLAHVVDSEKRSAANNRLFAEVAARAGNMQQAEEYLRAALRNAGKAELPDHPRVADHLFDLGSHLASQGKMADAAKLLRRSLKIRQKRLPKSDQRIKKTRELLLTCESD